jgi:hypothetical protein
LEPSFNKPCTWIVLFGTNTGVYATRFPKKNGDGNFEIAVIVDRNEEA